MGLVLLRTLAAYCVPVRSCMASNVLAVGVPHGVVSQIISDIGRQHEFGPTRIDSLAPPHLPHSSLMGFVSKNRTAGVERPIPRGGHFRGNLTGNRFCHKTHWVIFR
jgi:hypothetical protein